MANQEISKIDVEIRSSVSRLRELREIKDKILTLMKEIHRMTADEREVIKASLEMLNKETGVVMEILKDHAAFFNSRNRNISPETEISIFNILKECIEDLDLGNQEIRSSDNFGVQEGWGNRNSSWYVVDCESKPKDPIFSLYDSDTSKEEEMKKWIEKNVDPNMKRRLLEKMKGSFSSSGEMEIDIKDCSDAFDDQGSSTNDRELREQRYLLIAGTSEEESNDGQFLSNIDRLVEELERLGEAEDK